MNGAVKIKSLDGFFVEDVRNDSKDFIDNALRFALHLANKKPLTR
jgi:hypothetical protein